MNHTMTDTQDVFQADFVAPPMSALQVFEAPPPPISFNDLRDPAIYRSIYHAAAEHAQVKATLALPVGYLDPHITNPRYWSQTQLDAFMNLHKPKDGVQGVPRGR